MNPLEWIENTPLGLWVRQSEWGYIIVLCAHAVGMAVVVGPIILINLRAAGLGRNIPILAMKPYARIAWIGFLVNGVSGVMLFAGNAQLLAANVAFILKIVLIMIGGGAVWVLWSAVRADAATHSETAVAPLRTRIVAVGSLTIWLGAIIAGRAIAYTIY